MKKIVEKIREGQYIKQLTDGFDALAINPIVPRIRCYKIVDIQDEGNEEKIVSSQFRNLILEYIGDNIKLPEKAHIYYAYYADELIPFCQFKITNVTEVDQI